MNKKVILPFLTLLSIAVRLLMSESSDAFDFVSKESQIKQICFSSWTDNPDVCASCDAITEGLKMAFEKGSLTADLERANKTKVKPIFFGTYAKVLEIRSAKKKIDDHQEKVEKFFEARFNPSVNHLLHILIEPEQHEQEIDLIKNALNNAEKNFLSDL